MSNQKIEKWQKFNNNDIINFIRNKRLDKDSMIEYVNANIFRIMIIVNKKYVMTDLNNYIYENISNYTYPYFYYNNRVETLGEEKLSKILNR
jgi:hypothetical protein